MQQRVSQFLQTLKNPLSLLSPIIWLFLNVGIPVMVDAQEAGFSNPIPDPFGISAPVEGDTLARLKLVDIDNDGILEAFVLLAENKPPLFEWRDVHYYENEGSNEHPDFVFVEAYPFGIPDGTLNWFWQFVDINGDGLKDFIAVGFIFDNPVSIILNTGTPEIPDFSGEFLTNPYGITLPVSAVGTNKLDGVAPTFVDIDQDGDLDLFYGGFFFTSPSDDAFYFSENIGSATAPQFSPPIKNPFGLNSPPVSGFHWEAFEDIDCDGDLDMYVAGTTTSYYFYENTGTAQSPDFSKGEIPSLLAPMSGSFVDIHGDGDLDLISGSNVPGINFYENTGSPQVNFGFAQNDNAFTFSDSSSSNASTWLWDFGDGTSSNLQNPVHIYQEEGAYEVCLSVWGETACHNKVCKYVYTQQFPWHNAPIPNPFGLEDNTAPDTSSWVRLVDIDNDGIKEAFILTFNFIFNSDPNACPPHVGWCGWKFDFYENTTGDSAPNFVYEETFPFGIPDDNLYWPIEFIDLDGDRDMDLIYQRWGLETSIAYLENTGTAENPWFGDSEFQINPFGIVFPVSDSIPGKIWGSARPEFVDIDADGDYDFFLGGHFFDFNPANDLFDENYYFYLNEGDCANPKFSGPVKNPFNLERPLIFNRLLTEYKFVDMDCDGDWDLFTNYAATGMSYHENTGTPTVPNFETNPVLWLIENGPPPAGFLFFFAYSPNSWIDIGGDGDLDQVMGGFTGLSFWENLSDGNLACQASIPQCNLTASQTNFLKVSFDLYPNPVEENLHFELKTEDKLEEIRVDIFDSMGKRIKTFSRNPTSSFVQEVLSMEGLNAGIYTLKLSSKNKFISKKFIKSN